jgi:putative transposase
MWNIRYWDNVLSPWAGRMRRALLVKYDPGYLSRVYVRDPDGKYWPVPCADLGQPPITLWELQEANRRIRRSAQSITQSAFDLCKYSGAAAGGSTGGILFSATAPE